MHNRGNYRQDLFTVADAGVCFERTLFDACERFGRRLHAYVLMSNPRRRAVLHRQLCRGWYIGTRKGKRALVKELDKGCLACDEEGGRTGYGEERAETLLEEGLQRLGKKDADLSSDRKLAPWKVVLAGWIQRHCAVTNRWFSETMH